MAKKNKCGLPGLLRILLTWLRWRRLETLKGGVLRNLTIASQGFTGPWIDSRVVFGKVTSSGKDEKDTVLEEDLVTMCAKN